MRALLGALVFAVGRVPFRALGVFGAALGTLAWLLGIRRAHVQAAMTRAGVASPRASAFAMYRSLGVGLLELLWLSARPRARLDELVTIAPGSRGAWDRARASGRGVVLAASHTGNWDLAACRMAQELELLVVTKRLRVRALDELWQRTRAARGVRLTDAAGALGRAREVLARRGAVAMMIDQVPANRTRAVEVEFLGAPVLVDRAPAVLAARTGAPLVVSAAQGRSLEVLGVLEPPSRAEGGRARSAWVDAATIEATALLDGFVRRHPEGWLWLHRRWRVPSSRVMSRNRDA